MCFHLYNGSGKQKLPLQDELLVRLDEPYNKYLLENESNGVAQAIGFLCSYNFYFCFFYVPVVLSIILFACQSHSYLFLIKHPSYH